MDDLKKKVSIPCYIDWGSQETAPIVGSYPNSYVAVRTYTKKQMLRKALKE